MRIRSLSRPAAFLIAGALVATACSSDDPAESSSEAMSEEMSDEASEHMSDEMMAPEVTTVSEGVLSVCSDIPYAPFEMEDETTATGYSGFDIEIMDGIASYLGLELAVSVTGFDAIQNGSALAADACDVAASAMTITEEREQNVDFAAPYFDADQSLLVTSESGIATLADITGSLGVQADTTGQAYATENFEGDIQEFPGAAELFAALAAGNIDGILQDLPVNADRAQQDDSLTIAETFPTGEQYGFAVKEGNTQLLDGINAALAHMRDNGDYDALYSKYFEA